jgi:hypothetical protein
MPFGCRGEFTLEADQYYKNFQPEQYEKALGEMARVARELVK